MKNTNFIINSDSLFCDKNGLNTENIDKTIDQLKTKINDFGYCVIRNFGCKNENIDNKKEKLYKFLSKIGNLTGHNTSENKNNLNSIFWDIKCRGEEYNKKNQTTFSEKTGDCPLHSDSSFILNPENYLVMYVVKPAESGGESLFLSYSQIYEKLLETEDGKSCLQILEANKFPFQTPQSFDKDQKIIWEKIIEKDEKIIRFRHDCIQNGIVKNIDKISNEMQWSVDFLTKIINEYKNINEFKAVEDDLIIIDNRKGLHARKNFKDVDRHYIRARISLISNT